MDKIKVTLDNITYTCQKGLTVLELANLNDIYIPTLCYLKNICDESNCRMCIVENLKNGKLITACSTKIEDGMILSTESDKVLASRRKTLEMLLSKHHKDCENCEKNGQCKLQDQFDIYKVHENNRDYVKPKYEIDDSSPCIIRDNNKCILCARCINMCSKIQEVHALTKFNRGFNTLVGCAFNSGFKDSPCVGCGQCTLVCPTAALMLKSEISKVINFIKNKKYFVVAQVAPSVRVSLAEAFGEEIGTFDEGRMVNALKELGFNKVFDVNMGADFTTIEESNELLERINANKDLPLFSSCCPAWFKFVQNLYPKHTNLLSSCKSPTEMLGSLVKNYYANKENLTQRNIKVIGIMPCTAKKGEKLRAKDVDAVITTRELAKLIKLYNIDYVNLEPMPFDTPLSTYTGAGLLFGATGGVTEAVLRNVCEKLDKSATKVKFNVVRKSKGRKDVKVKAGNTTLNLCIVNGLANAKTVMEDIINKRKEYHFVEVMACPGGCVNGGGQNYVDYDKFDVTEVIMKRAASIYKHDEEMKERKSSQNLTVSEIYKTFFVPSPEKAKELLHYRKH